jgi:type IV fimbrial biogenesis protein FimT
MKNRNQTGFTLYELLTTMLIVGVVLSLGIPNMQSFRQNSRMTSVANDLHSSFHLARSEASRAKDNITICASLDPMGNAPDCDIGAEFEDGWIVFQDTNANLAVDALESILRRFPALHTSITITSNGTRDYFTYASTGLGRTANGETPVSAAILCDERGNPAGTGNRTAARVLIVIPLGRATVLRDEAQINARGGCP